MAAKLLALNTLAAKILVSILLLINTSHSNLIIFRRHNALFTHGRRSR